MLMILFNHKRRIDSIRISHRDYASPGFYFITLCTKQMASSFGFIKNGAVCYSPIGGMAYQCWLQIPDHFPHIGIDAFVVMPNQVHGILVLEHWMARQTRDDQTDHPITHDDQTDHVEGQNIASLQKRDNTPHTFGPLKTGVLPQVIRTYKSTVTRWCNRQDHHHFAWQHRYDESIIRSTYGLPRVRTYIKNNPEKWIEEYGEADTEKTRADAGTEAAM